MNQSKIATALRSTLLGLCLTGTALAADPPDFTGVWGTYREPGATGRGGFGQVPQLPLKPDAQKKVDEYRALRAAVGWSEHTVEAMQRGLAGARFSCVVSLGGEVVGCGRIVGDGGLYLYLQDVIVMPAHQGHGAGTAIMDALIAHLDREAPRGAFIGLMAASGAEPFYERYGFERRPDDRPGMFRIW